jgi:hypothetical protein
MMFNLVLLEYKCETCGVVIYNTEHFENHASRCAKIASIREQLFDNNTNKENKDFAIKRGGDVIVQTGLQQTETNNDEEGDDDQAQNEAAQQQPQWCNICNKLFPAVELYFKHLRQHVPLPPGMCAG